MTVRRRAYLVVRASLSAETWDGQQHPVLNRDEHYQPLTSADAGSVQVPEVAFLDRRAAERERESRERAARQLLNPFWLHWSELESLTSTPADDFRAQIAALGLTTPPPVPTNYGDNADWRTWWDLESADWSEEQRAAIWDMLDKMRLFEVVEVELE